MSMLDAVKKDCTEEESVLIATRLNNIAAEFNMIRQLNPTIEVQMQREEPSGEPTEATEKGVEAEMSPSQMETGQPQFQGEGPQPDISENSQEQSTNPPSFIAAVDKTFNELRAYVIVAMIG